MPLTIEEQIERSRLQTEETERKKRERQERKAAREEKAARKKLQSVLDNEVTQEDEPEESVEDKPLTQAQKDLYAKFPKADMIIDKGVVEIDNRHKKPHVRFTSEDELIERAFERYDMKYARGAARSLMPTLFRRINKIIRNKDVKDELVVKVLGEMLPYAFDRPGTAQAKDEGPKRVLIVKDAKELPDVS